MNPRTRLEAAARQLQVDLSPPKVDALFAYLALIQKWNKVYNLTAVREPEEMLTHHLLDSLAVVAPLRREISKLLVAGADGTADDQMAGKPSVAAAPAKARRLLDVGSGAGLPGVVIAICCQNITVDCVDTVAKKAAFISQVAATLKLPNLRGVHARVENLKEKYQVISARAFASLPDFTALSGAALAEQGIWLAMKAKHPADELAALPPGVAVFHVEQLSVPQLDAERCIVWMRKS